MTIKDVIEEWRTERLKKDPLPHDPDERVDQLTKDLIDFVKKKDLTFEELVEELDDNIREWVENQYIQVQDIDGEAFR